MIIPVKKQMVSLLLALLLVMPAMSHLAAAPDAATVAAAPCGEESLTRNARIALVEARKEMENKQVASARKILLDFIQKNPDENHPFVAFTLAGLFYDQNEQTKALEHYQKSVELCPSYGPGWQNLGKICFDHKKFARAADAMEKAYELDKQKNPQLLFHAAVSHISANAPRKAFKHMQYLTSGKIGTPDLNQLKILANLALELKCPGKAMGTIQKWIDQPNPDPMLWRLAASLYLEQKKYRQATEALAAFALVHPPTVSEEVLLGDLYNRIGIPYKAALLYERAMEKRPEKSLCKRLISSWMEACCPDRALTSVEKGLKRYPQCHFLWKMKGWLYYEARDFETAAMAFSKAHELNHKDKKSLFMVGVSATKAGQTDMAEKALKAVEKCPKYKTQARSLMRELAQHMENS